ncbi:MAG: 30S ribosome-binding factor RbfA [Syntrophorhabdaceae bacterium]|nr:30S ribosome-binding factor RbfA [Syntrophorhabdales bacterium]MBP9560842.1 30S ribosome-binding factor RbfA [Syntrophorhabdaceae bacterium]
MRYRRLRVQDQLREEVSQILFKDIKDPGLGFVTILEVKLTEDLKIAKIFCSIYGGDDEKTRSMAALNRSKGYIRFLLGQRVKLRYTPDIIFILDDTYEKAARIEEILRRERDAKTD